MIMDCECRLRFRLGYFISGKLIKDPLKTDNKRHTWKMYDVPLPASRCHESSVLDPTSWLFGPTSWLFHLGTGTDTRDTIQSKIHVLNIPTRG